jgi:hypothetical protein
MVIMIIIGDIIMVDIIIIILDIMTTIVTTLIINIMTTGAIIIGEESF